MLQQVANPVASLPKDNNGVLISLPSIAAAGAPSLPYVNADGSGLVPAGQLILGIGTESNNALGSATIYATDTKGNFAKVAYNGASFLSGGTVNSSSGSLGILSAAPLNMTACTDNAYYCPAATTPVTITAYGNNGTSGTVTLNIANADLLFGTNSTYAAFSNLARPAGTGLAANYFSLGLPFFYGRKVFVGIAATNANAPNGYFAF